MMGFLGGPSHRRRSSARHRRYLPSDPATNGLFAVTGPEAAPVGWVGFWESEWGGEIVWECGWSVLPRGSGPRCRHGGRGLTIARRPSAAAPPLVCVAFPSVDNAPSNALCRALGFEWLRRSGGRVSEGSPDAEQRLAAATWARPHAGMTSAESAGLYAGAERGGCAMKKSDRNALVACPWSCSSPPCWRWPAARAARRWAASPSSRSARSWRSPSSGSPSSRRTCWQTERFFDLTGGLTYVAVAVVALALSSSDARVGLLVAMVVVWAVRLASYLFLRIRKAGADKRFDEIKPSLPRFLQHVDSAGPLGDDHRVRCAGGDHVLDAGGTRHASPPSASLSGCRPLPSRSPPTPRRAASAPIRPTRAGSSRRGLWSWSRHPNYFGEILLWVGVAVVALPALRGWQWVTLTLAGLRRSCSCRASAASRCSRRRAERSGAGNWSTRRTSSGPVRPRARGVHPRARRARCAGSLPDDRLSAGYDD